MRSLIRTLLLVVLLAPASHLFAAEQSTATRIEPYIEPETVAIVRINIKDLDAPAAFTALENLAGNSRGTIAKVKESVTAAVRDLRAAGAEQIYLVVSLAKAPPEQPLAVVVVGAGGKPDEVARLLSSNPVPGIAQHETIIEGNLVLAGAHEVLERAKTHPSSRRELLAALAATSDAPVQLLVVPISDQRRVLRELLPSMSLPNGKLDLLPLYQNIEWISAGLAWVPDVSVTLVTQTKNPGQARDVTKTLDQLLGVLAVQPRAQFAGPLLAELQRQAKASVENDRVVIKLNAENHGNAPLKALLPTVLGETLAAQQRAQATQNLKRIGIAMHNYHDSYKSFPLTAIAAADGKPLLSWRVALLPFLGEERLYRQFKFDEPWDSAHNRPLLEKIPEVFADATVPGGRTRFLVPVGDDVAFVPNKPITFHEFKDGTSNTILLLEVSADHAVPWSQPEDLPAKNDADVFAALRPGREGMFLALFADGSVRALPLDMKPAQLRAVLTRAGGEVAEY